MGKLTYSQRVMLKRLVEDGEVWASCTNQTLSALERRGLAIWDRVPGRAFERWTATPAVLENSDG